MNNTTAIAAARHIDMPEPRLLPVDRGRKNGK